MVIHFDGGSRGNPGPSASAAVTDDGHTTTAFFENATSNEAEWIAAVMALHLAILKRVDRVVIKGDSLLIINQLKGKWQVKSKHLKEYYLVAKRAIEDLPNVKFEHVPREKNTIADNLVNYVLDKASKGVDDK